MNNKQVPFIMQILDELSKIDKSNERDVEVSVGAVNSTNVNRTSESLPNVTYDTVLQNILNKLHEAVLNGDLDTVEVLTDAHTKLMQSSVEVQRVQTERDILALNRNVFELNQKLYNDTNTQTTPVTNKYS